ncbi:PLCXD2, partial [Symbiodinium microadriaticum]
VASDQSWQSASWSDASWARPWGWNEWGGEWSSASWHWAHDSWDSWSGYDWNKWEKQADEQAHEKIAGNSEKAHEKKASNSEEAREKQASNSEKADDHDATASRVEAILRRGHTVDQLTTEELHLIVGHIDKQKKAETSQANQHEEKDAEKPDESNKPSGETKEERRKRLHARNMRYYRSLDSMQCPPEISKLARKAVDDPGQRSYMFEAWLAANEDWKKSSLLVTLRRKGASARRGLRKWVLYSEMIEKWGETIAQAMVEAKQADEHKRKHEIRPFPDAPHLQQYLCLFEASEEDLDEEAFEMVFSGSPEVLTAEEQEFQETKSKANKAIKKANERIKAAQKVKSTTEIDGMGAHLLIAMKNDVEAQAQVLGEARAELQAAVDQDEASRQCNL